MAAAEEALGRVRPALRGGLARRAAAQDRLRQPSGERHRSRPGPARAAWRENAADFTLTFRRLCDAAAGRGADAAVRALFADPTAYDAWAARWRQRLAAGRRGPRTRAAAMRAVNPAFIPRNHVVEAALDAAVTREDFGPFEELLEVPVATLRGAGRATSATPHRPLRSSVCNRHFAAPDIGRPSSADGA